MQNQTTHADGEIGKMAAKLAHRAKGHGWNFSDAEDYQQDYHIAQLESGVSLEEFEKTQHFYISNRVSGDGKSHRVCRAAAVFRGGNGEAVDALENVQSHYDEYPVGLMTDYQRRVFEYLAELDEETIMQKLGVRIDRAKQVLNRATEILIRVAANPDDYEGFFENLEIRDFDAWFRVAFRGTGCGRKPGKTGGGDTGQGNLFDGMEGGEV